MRTEDSPDPVDASLEVHALIATLHETGRRLEELTGGEVDAVTDPEGRAILLGRPQEQLRNIEAAKQAAILNALPASIALLDSDGRILSVNKAWRDLGTQNAFGATESGVGLNYLQVCERARGDNASEALLVAEGIRSVLASTAPSFSIEYPSRTGSVQRWIRLTATPLSTTGLRGAVVMHLDVTAERQTELNLQASESRFRELLQNVHLFSVMLDREGRVTFCNEYFLKLTGWSRDEVMGADWFASFLASEAGEAMPAFRDMLEDFSEAWYRENQILTKAGDRRLVRWNNSLLRSGTGDIVGTASIGEDITEARRTEVGIKRLSRVHAIVSAVNNLIVRTRDRDELFREACRITVEMGAFQMAWIGTIDPKTGDGKVVASHGAEDGYLDQVQITARDGLTQSERPASRALRSLKPVVCNDIETDPSIGPLRNNLLKQGYKSVACFPVTMGGKAAAVLSLFARDTNAFDDEESGLLLNLAGDISFALDHLEKQEKLDYLAFYDELTGLANRTLFLDRLSQHMRTAAANGHALALFLFDIERFKNINDSLGRDAGDDLLKQSAQWMVRKGGDATLLARVGADHFAAMLPEVYGGDVTRLVEATLEAFVGHSFRLGDAVLRISVKLGIALAPVDGADAETLFRNAEAALKKAKARGDRYLFYTPKMTEAVAGELTLENQLRQALKRGEFVLHYQAKVRVPDGKLTGAEALIRWNDPRTGLVPPGKFIPILEQTGLILDVGRWGLAQAIEDHRRWRAEGLPGAVRIAVNVSHRQLRDPNFIADIRNVLDGHAHVAHGLELEITESVIMEDVKNTISTLQAIRDLGITIAIDDFGTGFSSLSYLSKLPVDTLKIDRSFVVDMTLSPEGLSLVSTVINLAHSMKLKVVAEGVETEEQSRLLRLLGCDEIQGFLFSRPVPCREFESQYLAGI